MAVSQADARVIYKPKNGREEFFVFADPDKVNLNIKYIK